VEYRQPGQTRHEIPAEVCDTCSDFNSGQLVPVAFCPMAKAKSDDLYEYLKGGPRPAWMGPSVFEKG
jgi:hypothetical protein